jgi:CPA1 family monovalent cation:H+ antiporter
MSLFGLFALLITVTALLSWFNERYLRLPATIGVLVASMSISVVLVTLGLLGLGVERWAEQLLERVDFNALLMQGLLSFLLFAGALHVDLSTLLSRKWTILSLATAGVLTTTVIVGTLAWWIARLVGIELPYAWALVFGALIAPTDPIAVLGVLKQTNTPPALKAMIAGESLFNDGVGVVLFSILVGLLAGGKEVTFLHAAELFLVEAVGGALLGLILGYVTYRMLRSVDDHAVEVLLTLALVAGGYALAGALHTSGPLAMVVAGLFIGNHGRAFGMSERTREHLDSFWELIDEILNALLFVMIGFELLILEPRPVYLALGLLAIPVVLGARWISVSVPIGVLRRWRSFPPYTVTMLTWGGLRGGISIALALSLPPSTFRDGILVVTYVVVVFSVLVQGLSMSRLARWTAARA